LSDPTRTRLVPRREYSSDVATTETGVFNTPERDRPNRLLATELSFVTTEDTPITLDLLTSYESPDGPRITVLMVTQGSHGTVSPISTHLNTVRYSPAPGFRGHDSFRYTISDGEGGMAVAPVTITVIADGPDGPPD
jgi:hypothetical protein